MKNNTWKQKNGQSELLSRCLAIIKIRKLKMKVNTVKKPYLSYLKKKCIAFYSITVTQTDKTFIK